MNKLIVLTFVTLINLTACNTQEPTENETLAANHCEITLNGNTNVEDMLQIDSYEFLPLETNDQSIFSDINKLIYRNESIYILDRFGTGALFVFDSSGKFRYKIDDRGRGYGEYIELSDFDVDQNGDVFIYDVQSRKVLQYDKERMVHEVRVEPPALEFSLNPYKANEIILFKTFDDIDFSYLFNTFDIKMNEFSSRYQYKDHFYDRSYIVNYSLFGLYHSNKSRVYYKRFTNNIYAVENDGMPKKIVTLKSDQILGEEKIATIILPKYWTAD